MLIWEAFVVKLGNTRQTNIVFRAKREGDWELFTTFCSWSYACHWLTQNMLLQGCPCFFLHLLSDATVNCVTLLLTIISYNFHCVIISFARLVAGYDMVDSLASTLLTFRERMVFYVRTESIETGVSIADYVLSVLFCDILISCCGCCEIQIYKIYIMTYHDS